MDEIVFGVPEKCGNSSHHGFTPIIKFRIGRIRIHMEGVSADQGGPRFRLR
jgi:hypothetical protein